MPQIVLTEEQARVLTQAHGPVAVQYPQGRTLATVTALDPSEVVAIERSKEALAAGGPGVPSAEVQAHLRRLEEISQREDLDEDKMLELLRRMRAGERV
jgi:hypothetical protein